MLQVRPTFSESWYRVVGLRPKLRGTAQISRQFYRGDRWYVVRDPAGNQFHRLNDSAYKFVGLLDGRRTVGECWDLVGGQLADDAPTQPEVIQILSQLYAANLVETDIPPDATVLLRRHKTMQKRRWQGRLMNILFPRIPLWDPDNFLKRWMPVLRPFLSKAGWVLWFAMVIGAIAALAPHWTELKLAAQRTVDIGANPENAFWLWLTFVLIKFIHELGHAFACRRFGGECHEMGIMFLVFVPTPYVDASAAWSFPNRWHRMFVGAGGMIIELFVASICAFIWLNTNDTLLINHLAYNAMLIASVTTVIFNANPLLRYDGYYMLSDWLEIPNLQQKSREYVFGLIKRNIWKLKQTQPLPPPGQRAWLFFYGITSSIYRIFVGIAIILMVTWSIPILGPLMALSGVITWLVVPVIKLIKYLTIDPELHRKRGRGWALTGAVTAALVLLIGIIPFPVRVRGEGVVEPIDRQILFAKSSGFVATVEARDGQRLKKGEVILSCASDELLAQREQIRATIGSVQHRLQKARTMDQNQAKIELSNLQIYQQQLADVERKIERLTIRAPIDGFLVAPDIAQFPGRYFAEGQEVCMVQQSEQLELRGTIDQKDAQLVINRQSNANLPKANAEVQVAGDIGVFHEAVSFGVWNAADNELTHPLQTLQGGGEVQPDPKDPSGRKSAGAQFQLRVQFENPDNLVVPGQRAYVRIDLEKKPLLWQWTRAFYQLVQTRSAASKWL